MAFNRHEHVALACRPPRDKRDQFGLPLQTEQSAQVGLIHRKAAYLIVTTPSVVWISFMPLQKTPNGYTATFASIRYRLTIPARAMQAAGWQSRIVQIGPTANRKTLLSRFTTAGAVIVSKLAALLNEYSAAADRALDLVKQLQATGIPVVADFSDDHFNHPIRGAYYRNLAGMANLSIACTPDFADVVRKVGANRVAVVTDPVEGNRGLPRVRSLEERAVTSADPLDILWFGHQSNLRSLEHAIPSLNRIATQHALSLVIVTAGGPPWTGWWLILTRVGAQSADNADFDHGRFRQRLRRFMTAMLSLFLQILTTRCDSRKARIDSLNRSGRAAS